MNIVKKLLFYYCLIFAFFLLIMGVANSKTIEQLFFQVIFFPVPAYFAFTFIRQLGQKNTNHDSPLPLRKKTALFVFVIFFFLVATSIMQITQKGETVDLQTSMQKAKKPEATMRISPTTTPQKIIYVVVKTDAENIKVNIREQASEAAKVLQKVTRNEKFPLVAEDAKWYKIVLTDGSFGFIYKDLAITVSSD